MAESSSEQNPNLWPDAPTDLLGPEAQAVTHKTSSDKSGANTLTAKSPRRTTVHFDMKTMRIVGEVEFDDEDVGATPGQPEPAAGHAEQEDRTEPQPATTAVTEEPATPTAPRTSSEVANDASGHETSAAQPPTEASAAQRGPSTPSPESVERQATLEMMEAAGCANDSANELYLREVDEAVSKMTPGAPPAPAVPKPSSPRRVTIATEDTQVAMLQVANPHKSRPSPRASKLKSREAAEGEGGGTGSRKRGSSGRKLEAHPETLESFMAKEIEKGDPVAQAVQAKARAQAQQRPQVFGAMPIRPSSRKSAGAGASMVDHHVTSIAEHVAQAGQPPGGSVGKPHPPKRKKVSMVQVQFAPHEMRVRKSFILTLPDSYNVQKPGLSAKDSGGELDVLLPEVPKHVAGAEPKQASPRSSAASKQHSPSKRSSQLAPAKPEGDAAMMRRSQFSHGPPTLSREPSVGQTETPGVSSELPRKLSVGGFKAKEMWDRVKHLWAKAHTDIVREYKRDQLKQRATIVKILERGVRPSVEVGESVDYEKQGNLLMYTEEAMQQRSRLRNAPAIKAAIKNWWEMLGYAKANKMTREQYVVLCSRLVRLLNPTCKDNQFEVRRYALEDWNREMGPNSREMDFEKFHFSMFELADLWTDEIDEAAYVAFLEKARVDFARLMKKDPHMMPRSVPTKERESEWSHVPAHHFTFTAAPEVTCMRRRQNKQYDAKVNHREGEDVPQQMRSLPSTAPGVVNNIMPRTFWNSGRERGLDTITVVERDIDGHPYSLEGDAQYLPKKLAKELGLLHIQPHTFRHPSHGLEGPDGARAPIHRNYTERREELVAAREEEQEQEYVYVKQGFVGMNKLKLFGLLDAEAGSSASNGASTHRGRLEGNQLKLPSAAGPAPAPPTFRTSSSSTDSDLHLPPLTATHLASDADVRRDQPTLYSQQKGCRGSGLLASQAALQPAPPQSARGPSDRPMPLPPKPPSRGTIGTCLVKHYGTTRKLALARSAERVVGSEVDVSPHKLFPWATLQPWFSTDEGPSEPPPAPDGTAHSRGGAAPGANSTSSGRLDMSVNSNTGAEGVRAQGGRSRPSTGIMKGRPGSSRATVSARRASRHEIVQ